jgi:hypothetical protein
MSRSFPRMAVRFCAVGLLAAQTLAAQSTEPDRTILPIQEPARPLFAEIDVYAT